MKYPVVVISLHENRDGVVMSGVEPGLGIGVDLSNYPEDNLDGPSQPWALLETFRAIARELNPNWRIDLTVREPSEMGGSLPK